jgi:hypothetical protein
MFSTSNLLFFVRQNHMQNFRTKDNPFWEKIKLGRKRQKSASADGGPRSQVCAHLTLHSAAHRH